VGQLLSVSLANATQIATPGAIAALQGPEPCEQFEHVSTVVVSVVGTVVVMIAGVVIGSEAEIVGVGVT